MAFDSLSEKLQNVFKGLRSKGRLSEEDVKAALKEVRLKEKALEKLQRKNAKKAQREKVRKEKEEEKADCQHRLHKGRAALSIPVAGSRRGSPHALLLPAAPFLIGGGRRVASDVMGVRTPRCTPRFRRAAAAGRA